jgi:proteasome lid subunit RPN8/RPN11
MMVKRSKVTIEGPSDISEEAINKMKELIDLTFKDGKERGFQICKEKKTGKARITNPCIGDECKIDKPRECEEKDVLLLDFHTHPVIGPTGPSTADFKFSVYNKVEKMCVGSKIQADYDKIRYGDYFVTCLNLNELSGADKDKLVHIQSKLKDITHFITKSKFFKKFEQVLNRGQELIYKYQDEGFRAVVVKDKDGNFYIDEDSICSEEDKEEHGCIEYPPEVDYVAEVVYEPQACIHAEEMSFECNTPSSENFSRGLKDFPGWIIANDGVFFFTKGPQREKIGGLSFDGFPTDARIAKRINEIVKEEY